MAPTINFATALSPEKKNLAQGGVVTLTELIARIKKRGRGREGGLAFA